MTSPRPSSSPRRPLLAGATSSLGLLALAGSALLLTGAPLLGQTFGPQQVLSDSGDVPIDVFATDLDGDGDADVLSADWGTKTIAWHENLGAGIFGPAQVIPASNAYPKAVHAADLDGDGDADVLSASRGDDTVAWYENLGGGAFGPQGVITDAAGGVFSVYATDLDFDGDADVLSAGWWDDTVAWYENLSPFPSWSDLGQALAGSTTPSLVGSGVPVGGSTVTLSLTAAPPFALSYLVIGVAPLNAPFKGGVLVPQVHILVPLFSNLFGEIELSYIWPEGLPGGVSG